MRKLASIKLVNGISPIEGKDRIELAFFDGWQIIVKKGEFKAGDMAVFIEIDSVLPDRPEFDFLRSKDFRIKTMKMGGVLSQGICFPMDILPTGKYKEGQDVTEILGIKQYEKTIDREIISAKSVNPVKRFLFRFRLVRRIFGGTKKEKSGFPDFITKTDEVRIQNIPQVLENDYTYTITEKIDGQSGTFFLKRIKSRLPFIKDKFDFGVCSRNVRLFKPDNSTYWFVAKKYNIENVLKSLINNNDFVAIQGECIGSNVQGNKYKVTEPDLFVFNLMSQHGKIDSIYAAAILLEFGIKFVPHLNLTLGGGLPKSVNDVLSLANGKSKIGDTLREGIVCRNHEHNISFKAVSPEFLLKYDE